MPCCFEQKSKKSIPKVNNLSFKLATQKNNNDNARLFSDKNNLNQPKLRMLRISGENIDESGNLVSIKNDRKLKELSLNYEDERRNSVRLQDLIEKLQDKLKLVMGRMAEYVQLEIE